MKLIKYVILGILVILGVNAILSGGEEEEETT